MPLTRFLLLLPPNMDVVIDNPAIAPQRRRVSASSSGTSEADAFYSHTHHTPSRWGDAVVLPTSGGFGGGERARRRQSAPILPSRRPRTWEFYDWNDCLADAAMVAAPTITSATAPTPLADLPRKPKRRLSNELTTDSSHSRSSSSSSIAPQLVALTKPCKLQPGTATRKMDQGPSSSSSRIRALHSRSLRKLNSA